MNIQIGKTLKAAQHMLSENSPAILTGLGVAGTISTAVLAAQGAMKARHILDAQTPPEWTHEEKKLDWRAGFKLTWKCYIPAATTGATTVASILGANHISSKRMAAVVSAYSISETMFKEYKDKVIETLGEKKELAVRDEIAQDRVNANPPSGAEVVITSGGEVMCYETFTARYFKSDMETIRKAQNDINAQLINEGYASLNDFFGLIGLPHSGVGEEVGWTVDEMLDIHFSTVLSDDNKPCISVGYKTLPVRNYYRFN